MVRQNSLRVLEDYELDYVSGGYDEEPGFLVNPFELPEGYTLENISGVYLEQDHATGVWTAEFVFEANFGANGYTGGDDGGGGFHVDEPIGGFLPGDIDGGGALHAGGSKTVKVEVTRTTSPSWSIKWNWYGPTFQYNSGTTVTTTTTTTTTVRSGRVTGSGATGSLPPPK